MAGAVRGQGAAVSAGPPARRRPGTTWPSVTPWGGGGVPAPPRAGIPQEEERRARSRAAAPRPLPPTPPPRGAPAPAGPGSQEASLPRPADQVRCEAGAGVMEKTPPPPNLGGCKLPRGGRRGGVVPGARGPSGRDPGPLPGKVRDGLGRSERRARRGRGRAGSAGLAPPARGSARIPPPVRTGPTSHPDPAVWLVTRR